MSVERLHELRGHDHYYWLTSFLAARGVRKPVSRSIAFVVLVLGALQLALLFSPSGPHGLPAQLLSGVVAICCVVIAALWLRSWWPTRAQSLLCGALGAVSVAIVSLIQPNPLVGFLACIIFALISGIAAILHSGRPLVFIGVVMAVTVLVLAARVAATDVVLAVCEVLVVVVVTVFVTVTFQMVLRMVEAGMLAAEIEPLTGLFNRSAFYDRVATLIGSRSRDDDRFLAVFVIDLDGFSLLTGTSGVTGGNRARVTVGQRLRETVRREAIVGHVDDSEFLVAELFTTADALPLAERIRAVVNMAPLRLTASIGVVSTSLRPLVAVSPYELLDEMLTIAQSAMQEARRAGGNQVRQVVSPPLQVLED
jgi:diguanylate cyclase (GGDEF)-like protein